MDRGRSNRGKTSQRGVREAERRSSGGEGGEKSARRGESGKRERAQRTWESDACHELSVLLLQCLMRARVREREGTASRERKEREGGEEGERKRGDGK